jgi:hypothetical protein
MLLQHMRLLHCSGHACCSACVCCTAFIVAAERAVTSPVTSRQGVLSMCTLQQRPTIGQHFLDGC